IKVEMDTLLHDLDQRQVDNKHPIQQEKIPPSNQHQLSNQPQCQPRRLPQFLHAGWSNQLLQDHLPTWHQLLLLFGTSTLPRMELPTITTERRGKHRGTS